MPFALATVWYAELLSCPRRGLELIEGIGSFAFPLKFEFGKHDLNMIT